MTLRILPAAGVALAPLWLTGCGEEAPPPPPPPPRNVAPPPPPIPDRVVTEQMLADIGADARVQFPNRQAPYDRSLAEAVARFAGAFASGDDLAIAEMLDPAGQAVLDQLISSGEWYEATGELEAVRVVYLAQTPDETEDASSAEFVLAIQEPGEAYVLGWIASDSDGWRFTAEPTTNATRARADEWDSDSMRDFAPGASGARGPGSPMSVADALAEDPTLVFVAMEFSRQLLKVSGLEGLTNAMETETARTLGLTGARLDSLSDQGREAVRNGERPPAEIAGAFIMGARVFAESLGNEITDQQIIEALAAVFQSDEAEARAYFEQAQP